jgi:TolB-like protein
MKKVKWVAISSLLGLLFLPGMASAEEIGILPFRTTGVEMYVTDAFYDLLESELAYYDHKVVTPYEIEHYLGHRVICYNKDYAADYGTSLGLEKVIFGSITKLGDKYIITVEVVKSRTGEILLSDKITLDSDDYLEDYVYALAEAIEEDVYGNVVYYGPDYSRTVTHVYIGNCWRPRIIWRRPRRSFISVRLPLININLGKPHHIVHRSSPPRTKTVYVKTNHRKDDHGKTSKGKTDHGKSKKGKQGQGKSKSGKSHRDDGGQKKGGRR